MDFIALRAFYYHGRMRQAGEVLDVDIVDRAQLKAAKLVRRSPIRSEFDASNASREVLEAEAKRRGIEVVGTGKDGNVLVADLRAALR